MKLNDCGLFIVIFGLFGVGKGIVCKVFFDMKNYNLEYFVLVIIRVLRVGEVDGKDYYFVNCVVFEEMIC